MSPQELNSLDNKHPFRFRVLDRHVWASSRKEAIRIYLRYVAVTEEDFILECWDNVVRLYRCGHARTDLSEYGAAVVLIQTLGLSTPLEVGRGL